MASRLASQMPTLLHIDSSPRYAHSFSRKLGGEAAQLWASTFAGPVIYRDLAKDAVPQLDEAWIKASNTPESHRTPDMRATLALSDTLIDELEHADYMIFAVPMYNFNVPASFKAYLDQVIRVNRTFYFRDGASHGTLGGRKALVITARGGYYHQGGMLQHDYQEPFLRYAFAFIGLQDISFVHAEGLGISQEASQAGLERARNEIRATIAEWAA